MNTSQEITQDPAVKAAMRKAEYVVMNSPSGGFALLDLSRNGEIIIAGSYAECLAYLRDTDPGHYHGLKNGDAEFLWKGEPL